MEVDTQERSSRTENQCGIILNPSSFSSSSVTAVKKTPHCVSLKKVPLTSRGYESFEDWNSNSNHEYIGRDMTHHVAGAEGSKWGNPFKAKKRNKKSVKKCLERYEDYIRRNPDLFNAVMELEGKELGCWCKPYACHGDILIKLFKERQGTNPSCQTLMESTISETYSSQALERPVSTSIGPHTLPAFSQRISSPLSSESAEYPITAQGNDPSLVFLQRPANNSNLTDTTGINLSVCSVTSQGNDSDSFDSFDSSSSLPLLDKTPLVLDGITTPNLSVVNDMLNSTDSNVGHDNETKDILLNAGQRSKISYPLVFKG